MAGELPEYRDFIIKQPCAACLGPGPCDPHHAQSGTTYDPDEAPPPKSAGRKRGHRQRSHDKWLIPMHFSCHGEFTDHRGHFRGWTKTERDQWEHEQVLIHRNRYAMVAPSRVPAPKARHSADSNPELVGWTVTRVLSLLRREAAQSHRSADAAAALNDVADVIEGRF